MTEAASFEELGLSAEVVESLSADGYERPTALQAAIVPVLRRGNDLVGAGGAGAGLLLSYGAPLLDRIVDETSQGALVLVPSIAEAVRQARSITSVASPLGVSVAALRSLWATPGSAQLLFATPRDVLVAFKGAELKLDQFDTVVVVGAAEIERTEQLAALETVIEQLPTGGLRAVFDLPVGPAADGVAERHFDKPVHVPPRSVSGASAEAPPPTGTTMLYQIVADDRPRALLGRLAELAGHGRRVTVLFRTDDQVADVGDLIASYGYAVGEVGDTEADVWISNDYAESVAGMQAAAEPLTVVCYETPPSREAVERAADDSHEWLVLVRSDELAHLRSATRAAGVRLRAAAPIPSDSLREEQDALAERLTNRIEEGGLAGYAKVAEALLAGHDPIEIAASALALLTESKPAEVVEVAEPMVAERAPAKAPVQAWSKLFVSVGERDGVRTGDLLGAVTNEAHVKGKQVGRIDVQESHSLIEVDGKVADRVIRALNGTSIRGRSLRVDYDRSHRRPDGRRSDSRGPAR